MKIRIASEPVPLRRVTVTGLSFGQFGHYTGNCVVEEFELVLSWEEFSDRVREMYDEAMAEIREDDEECGGLEVECFVDAGYPDLEAVRDYPVAFREFFAGLFAQETLALLLVEGAAPQAPYSAHSIDDARVEGEEVVLLGRTLRRTPARDPGPTPDGLGEGLSERARRMLDRAERTWTPPAREVVAEKLRAAGLEPHDAFLDFAERWAGLEYARRVRGGVSFELDLEEPDFVDDPGPLLWPGDRAASAWLGLWLAKDGRVIMAEDVDEPVPVADSIEEMVEADAIVDECLDLAPVWYGARSQPQVDYGPDDWPTPNLETLYSRVSRVARVVGAGIERQASGSSTKWWVGPEVRLRLAHAETPGQKRYDTMILSADPGAARACIRELRRVGITFMPTTEPSEFPFHGHYLDSVAPVGESLPLSGLLEERFADDACSTLEALLTESKNAGEDSAAWAASLSGAELIRARSRLGEARKHIELALSYEADPTRDDHAQLRAYFAALFAWWAARHPELEACVRAVLRGAAGGA